MKRLDGVSDSNHPPLALLVGGAGMDVFKERLLVEGFGVDQVPDGERGMDQFINASYAIVIARLDLPGRNGAVTLESIAGFPSTHDLVCVLVAPPNISHAYLSQKSKKLSSFKPALGKVMVVQEPLNVDKIMGEMVGYTRGGTAEASLKVALPFAWDRSVSVSKELQEVTGNVHLAETLPTVMMGELGQTSTIGLLKRIHDELLTGVLVMKQALSMNPQRQTMNNEVPTKVVHIVDGQVGSVQSNCLDEQWLPELEDLTAEPSVAEKRMLHLNRMLDLLSWNEGEYRFVEKEMWTKEMPVQLSFAVLCYEWMQAHALANPTLPSSSISFAELLIQRGNNYVKIHVDAWGHVQTLKHVLPPHLLPVIQELDGKKTLAEVHQSCVKEKKVPEEDYSKLMNTLHVLDALSYAFEPVSVAPTPNLQTLTQESSGVLIEMPTRPRKIPHSRTEVSSQDRLLNQTLEAERHYRRGVKAFEKAKWDEANLAFERALQHSEGHLDAEAYRCYVRFCIKEQSPFYDAVSMPEEALLELKRLASLTKPASHPTALAQTSVVPLKLQARLLDHLKRHPEAEKIWREIRERDPMDEEANQRLARPWD